MNTTAYIRYSEPTVRTHAAQAYSQCMPEPNHGYAPQPQYGSYYHDYAPVPQQPMPIAAPVAKSSSSSKGLLFVAGLAVVGAAAFGGVLLLNSNDAHTTQTTSTSAASATDPAGSAVINLPSAVDIPALAPAQNATAPVIVNNQAPVRVNGPAVSSPIVAQAPKLAPAPAQKAAAAPAPALAPAAAPVPALAPKPVSGAGGVTVKTPGVEVGVPSQGGVSVKTPGVEVGVPGQGGGGVVVAVPGGQAPTGQTKTEETKQEGTTPAQGTTPDQGATPADGAKQGGDTAANMTTNMK